MRIDGAGCDDDLCLFACNNGKFDFLFFGYYFAMWRGFTVLTCGLVVKLCSGVYGS